MAVFPWEKIDFPKEKLEILRANMFFASLFQRENRGEFFKKVDFPREKWSFRSEK